MGARLTEAAGPLSLRQALRVRRAGGFFVASFAAEWTRFIAAARRGFAIEPGVESARRLLQVVLAAARSASENRPIKREDAPSELAPSRAV